MITSVFVVKMGIVIGTGLVGSELFSNVVKNPLAKAIASYAGAMTGVYIGVRTANNLHHMLANAKKVVEEEEVEEPEVKVNG